MLAFYTEKCYTIKMNQVLNRYPVRATKFCKEVYSDSRQQRQSMRSATKKALGETTKPLLEVGGPTTKGYIALDGVKLPNGIIISNIAPEKGASLLADVRNLPFASKSLGGIVMQGLTRIPEEIAQAPRQLEGIPIEFQPDIMNDNGNLLKILFAAREEDYSGWGDQDIMNYSQRLAMLKEARRTVEPNGLLLATMLSGGEIRLAEQLGFEMTATTVPEIDPHALHYNKGEVLMTLTNMNTPAGIFVENLPAVVVGQ